MLELFENYPTMDFTQPQKCPVCGKVVLKSYPGRIHILKASLESLACFKKELGYDPKGLIDAIREQKKEVLPIHS